MRDLLPTIRMLLAPLWCWIGRWLRRTVIACGFLAVALMVLALTRIPYDIHRWLGMAGSACSGKVIVVLGGSGMPSGPELLRLHKAADLAQRDTAAQVVIIHPGDPEVLEQMAQELVLRGVERTRITTINKGDNTREQALIVAGSYTTGEAPLVLVTAPENMYRSVAAFKRAGHTQVCGASAWDHAMDHAFAYEHETIGGSSWAPDVSDDPGLRYTFWNYLKLEITCLREFLAIAYYKVNGWI